MKCPSCGNENKDSSKFCFKCGYKLSAPVSAVSPMPSQAAGPIQTPVQIPQAGPIPPLSPIPAASPIPSPAPIPATVPPQWEQSPVSAATAPIMEDVSTRPLISAFLIFKDSSQEINLPYKPVINIGRTDKAAGHLPDIDLTETDKAKVTSRKHAYISCTNGKYKIADQGSMNGTFLNSMKLEQGKEYDLKNGDEIIFGKLACIFNCIG